MMLLYDQRNQQTKQWDVKHLRGYGQNDGTFSFETGRNSSDPEKTYFFEVGVLVVCVNERPLFRLVVQLDPTHAGI
jgi:hypothetical protein